MSSIIRSIKRVLSDNWLLTLFLNFYYFSPIKAVKCPMLFGYGVNIGSLGSRGCISVPSKFGSFCFALKRAPFKMGDKSSFWNIGHDSCLCIEGTCRMAKGIR